MNRKDREEVDTLVRRINHSKHQINTPLCYKFIGRTSTSYASFRVIMFLLLDSWWDLHVEDWYYNEMDFYTMKKGMWEFININLEKEDKPKVAAFAKEWKNDTGAVIIEMLAEGYKVSLSWVDAQNSYVVSVSGTDRSKNNNGHTLSSWSDDLSECIMMAGYKVLVIAETGTWLDHQTDAATWR